jgi:hypothetical protein
VPSPALVIAIVALSVALGGSALALPGKNSVNSGDIKKGAVKSSDIGDGSIKAKDVADGSLGPADLGPAARIWANVSSQGAMVSTGVPGATAARAGGPGQYVVDFNLGDISACATVAQIKAFTPEDGTIPGGSAATETLAGGTDAVRVDTTDPQGTQADRGFSLIVAC